MTQYTSQMFKEVKFCYKKCFANNRNDSRINKILYSVKLEIRKSSFNDKVGFRF